MQASATLTGPVLLAVLGGALLHASWNALVKSSQDKALDNALLHVLAGLIALPALLLTGLPAPASWPWVLASALIHVGYHLALAGAYRHGDLGLTYPIMRGVAPLLVALASGSLLQESPTPLAWLGIGGIALGVSLVGLAQPGAALGHRTAVAFALANAVIIASYTLVDSRGVRLSGNPIAYVLLFYVLNALPYPLLLWLRRGTAGRAAILAYSRRRWPLALLGGAASLGSYGLALWAMTRAPVASVAALRETSVVFAAVLGVWLLGERFGARRLLGTGLLVAGVMALRLG